MTSEHQGEDAELLDSLEGLKRRFPRLATGEMGARGERAQVIRSWGLPSGFERLLIEEWPPGPMTFDGSGELGRLAWKSVPARQIVDFVAPQVGLVAIGSGLCGDVVAVDFRAKGLPVYIVYMPSLVDDDRTSMEPFCIRFCDRLSRFLDSVGTEADGSWFGHDYHSALESCGDVLPAPEPREALHTPLELDRGRFEDQFPWTDLLQPKP